MYIQPDGIGIPGHVSAHVNTRTYIDACKFIRLYAFTLWNNSLEFVPFPIYLLPLPLPLSISLSFLPLLPSRRFSCKWHGLCLVHYYFFFSFFFFFILFSYLFTRAFHSFLTTRQPPPIISTLPRALFLHVVILLLPVILFFVFWSQVNGRKSDGISDTLGIISY